MLKIFYVMPMKFSVAVLFFLISFTSYAQQVLTLDKMSGIALMTNDYMMQEYLGDVHYYADKPDIETALKWYQVAAKQSAYAAAQAGEILRLGYNGVVDCKQAIEFAKKNRQLSRGEVNSIWMVNMEAWTYATCIDENFRDGQHALVLLQKRFDESKLSSIPVYILDTFAAAYAALGNFERARQYQNKVIELLGESEGDVREFEAHLHQYEKNQPWLESKSLLTDLGLLEELDADDKEIILLRKKRKILENYYDEINSEVTDVYVRLAKLYFDKENYFLSANYVSRARIGGVSPEALKKAGITPP